MTEILGVGGNRLVWTDLPEHVRAGVADILGAPVVDTRDEPGGFSPGLAARVECADGRRAFVKAVGTVRNPDSVGMFATEARNLAGLAGVAWPASVGVPALLGQFAADGWIALVIDEVPGRQPDIPWRTAELDRVVDAVQAMGDCLTPNPLDVRPITETCADMFTSWRELAGGPVDPRIPPWAAANLERLAELEAGWAVAAAGDTLLHLDLRADNLLLTDDRVYVVDWPHACVGAQWVDLLMMLPSVLMQGGDADRCWQRCPAARGVVVERVDTVLAAMTGYFVARSVRPAPPGLPRLRAFQRAQGEAAWGWLRTRSVR